MQLTSFHYGLAASVAALVVAAPVGMHMMRTHDEAYVRTAPASRQSAAVERPEVSTAAPSPRANAAEEGQVGGMPVTSTGHAAAESKPAEPQHGAGTVKKDVRPAEAEKAKAERTRDEDARRDAAGQLALDQGRSRNLMGARPDVRPQLQDKIAGVPSADVAAPSPPAAPPVSVAPAKPAPAGGEQYMSGLGVVGGVAPVERRTATLMPPPRVEPAPVQVEDNRDQFQATTDNPVKQVAEAPVSTFSIDVDTASYSFVRRALNTGRLPPKDAVRVEEMINYFPYDYPRPETAEVPFQPSVTVFPAPWNSAHQLVHIGLKGYELKSAERPHANIVLLIDTSGSMGPEDRLPLLKNAFRMLVDEMRPDDTVSIVTYAGDTRVALEPTRVSEKGRIIAAIEGLHAGGGTYGEGGIKKAYELAEASFDAKGINRIVLGTDGDFNIGISNRDELKGYVERKRDKGIFLSIVGVGRGNYNDALMQALAQNGNGTAAYVDTLNEARKVLVDEASSTLFPIAKDVKIQVEFNPAVVSEYRLIGYETRLLKREDFNNDKVDAGDVGSGHAVTAIYEVTPKGAAPSVDALRYGAAEKKSEPTTDTKQGDASRELGFLKLRYKLPKEDASRLLTLPIGPQQAKAGVADAPADVRFATAVAAFGQLLRGSPHVGGYTYDDVLKLAQGGRGEDRFGYRAEFLNLVRLAKSARN